jgi:hypothetical protein
MAAQQVVAAEAGHEPAPLNSLVKLLIELKFSNESNRRDLAVASFSSILRIYLSDHIQALAFSCREGLVIAGGLCEY